MVKALQGRADPIAIDRPGWDGRTEAGNLADNALAALAALDARGIERATIVGHSLGGAIAAFLAAHHPERVSALVLAAPAANLASLDALDRWLARPVVGSMASAAVLTSLGLVLSSGPIRRRVVRGSRLQDAYLRACGRALLTSWARRAFIVEQRALATDLQTLEPRLRDVRAPTWIVTGAEDRIVPPEAPRRLARQIRGARLVQLNGAGHLLPQLHAQRLADTVLAAQSAVTSL